MTKAELKTRLLQRIQNLNDENILKSLEGILDSFEVADSIWDNLTDDQKRRANLSYEQSFDESKLKDWEDVYKRKR